MNKKVTLIVLATSMVALSCTNFDKNTLAPTPKLRATASIIKPSEEKQLIRGFGAATVFRLNNPLNNNDLDLLFGNESDQIGLSILRIRVPVDNNARSIELNHAKGALARGAIVVASPWSPPAPMKTNNNLIGGALKEDSYEDYANYLNDFAKYMETNDAPLYAIGVQNEPDIQVSYESCDWTSLEIRDFMRDYGSLITDTKVISPESFNFNHSTTDALLNDAAAAENVDIIGGHIYGSGLREYPLAKAKNKEVWMTEHLDTDITWDAVFATAKEIHDCLAIGNFNAYIWWYAKRFYGPLAEDGTIAKRGYIMANFTKFIRPGYHRVRAVENPQTSLHVSAYQGDGKTVVVVINTGAIPVNHQFSIENTSATSVTPYITTENENLAKRASVDLVSEIEAFIFTLPAQSIVTFVTD